MSSSSAYISKRRSSANDPEDYKRYKKAMWKQTQEKLEIMKQVIINFVLNERK